MPTMKGDPDALAAELRAKGFAVTLGPAPGPAAPPPTDEPAPARRPKPPTVEGRRAVRATLVLPVECPSVANGRDWKGRSRAAKGQRQAVRRALQRHPSDLLPFVREIAGGGLVGVTLTRLGGRPLDERDNLRAALKPVVDELHAWIGLDDADSDGTLAIDYRQEPGGPVGVRVELMLEQP